MRKWMGWALFGALMTSIAASGPVLAQPASPKITIHRLDCGTFKQPRDVSAFADDFAYSSPPRLQPFAASCYLIRHGNRYMLWDAGFAAPSAQIALPKTVLQQLGEIGVDPALITFVGVSHYHADHIGQAASFPNATLLIGAADWAVLKETPPRYPNADPKLLAPWTTGSSKVETVAADRDVFGDGSVTILNLPGHTPGHHGLLVRLPKTGPVLISGDTVHFRENYEHDRVPTMNIDRADSLASMDRFKKLATTLKATVVIQHDPRDIAKLPAFPQAAE
jgi:glyoxylase-like metal-dependent hydrolase (beta-lactamase superfamily II)